jgi:hypothetical protein
VIVLEDYLKADAIVSRRIDGIDAAVINTNQSDARFTQLSGGLIASSRCQDISVCVVCLRRESKAPAPVLMSSTGTGIDRFCVVAFVGLVVVRVYGVVPLLLAVGGYCADGAE